jgi:hypothetical protein
MLKISAVLIAIGVAGTIAFLFWWKSECDARRAPCTIEIGSITFRMDRDAK